MIINNFIAQAIIEQKSMDKLVVRNVFIHDCACMALQVRMVQWQRKMLKVEGALRISIFVPHPLSVETTPILH